MLLQELKRYSERLSLPPTNYAEAAVPYIIDLDDEGNFQGLVATADPSNRATRRGVSRMVPQVQRANVVRPFVLVDRADYVLGYSEEAGERTARLHLAFLSQLERCLQATEEPAVRAVITFLRQEPLGRLPSPPPFSGGDTVAFRVDGVFPHDLPSVQAFWATENDPGAKDAPVLQCVVCGNTRAVLPRLQAKVKGVPGGQMSGTAIISANAGAFESWGLEASLIAPTCSDCGERFTKALNELIAGETSHLRIADSVFVFWTRSAGGDTDWLGLLSRPQAAEVQHLLQSVFRGRGAVEIDPDRFFGCSLSASGGRTVVRDWIDTTVGEAKQQLAVWFARQAVVYAYGEPGEPLGIFPLAAATVRDATKDLAPPTPRALLRAALTGTPLPPALLHAALIRSAVGERAGADTRTHVTRQQAALIKLALSFLEPYNPEEDTLIELDSGQTSVGYRCGRLLAILERAQRLAIPNVNQTVVDRFYGTAASTPRSVFPRLLQGAQPHIAKLRRDRRGAAEALNRSIEEISTGIATFPPVLSLEEQGLFALGYYHQRAYDRKEARRAAEARRSSQPPQTGAANDPETTDEAINEEEN